MTSNLLHTNYSLFFYCRLTSWITDGILSSTGDRKLFAWNGTNYHQLPLVFLDCCEEAPQKKRHMEKVISHVSS